jgi:hypothetical protein
VTIQLGQWSLGWEAIACDLCITYLICSKQVKYILIAFSILQSFTELKEEESSLLKERIVLQKVKFWSFFYSIIFWSWYIIYFDHGINILILFLQEIATKNANFEVMRNTNESLKRMKVYSKLNHIGLHFWYVHFVWYLPQFYFCILSLVLDQNLITSQVQLLLNYRVRLPVNPTRE